MKKKEMKQSAKLSIDLISTIIVTLIAGAVTVAAVISMAWFASNRDVGTSGASVTVDAELFEIEVDANTAGNRVTNKLVSDGYSLSPLLTSPTNDSIIGDIIIDSFDNYGNKEVTIRPGAFGRIVFSILPKKNNLVFAASPLLAGNPVDPNLNTLITGFDQQIDDLGVVTVDYGEALKLTYGHFLIFAQKVGNTYSDRVVFDGNTPVYFSGASTAGEKYTVTLYWIWARTYNDLLTLVSQESLAADPTYYFKGNVPGPTSYNNGDQVIGDAFADLAILGTVHTVESIPETEGTISVTAARVSS